MVATMKKPPKKSKSPKAKADGKKDGRSAKKGQHRPGKAICVSFPKDVFSALEAYRKGPRSPAISEMVREFLTKRKLLKSKA